FSGSIRHPVRSPDGRVGGYRAFCDAGHRMPDRGALITSVPSTEVPMQTQIAQAAPVTGAPCHAAATQATPDAVLIERIAGGNKVAMQILFARYNVRVYRFVLRMVRDQLLAEDLVSDVFLDVWRQADRFEARSAVSTWLLAIARFKALSA